MKELSAAVRAKLLKMPQNEVTEYYIDHKLANRTKDPHNKKVLEAIGNEELSHSKVWQQYTGVEVKPKRGRIFFYSVLAAILGVTFTLKKMESGEDTAGSAYAELIEVLPEAKKISEDEDRHEKELLAMLDEERLHYVGSMVLGLSDALVELTGTLAGLTFALSDTRLVALSGLITGVSATLSMASSEFLSARSEGRNDALKSCLYTGVAYLVTVALMILPYLLLSNSLAALIIMLVIVVAEIALFNYYTAVAQDLKFRRRFLEMAGISLSVAVISFLIGLLVKAWLGVDV